MEVASSLRGCLDSEIQKKHNDIDGIIFMVLDQP